MITNSYINLLKNKNKKLIPKIREKIKKGHKIYSDDIVHAISNNDIKVVSLLLDHIPKSEYFCKFYMPIVESNRSFDFIKLLHEYKVPLDNSILISYCIEEDKLNYIDQFVSLDKNILDEIVITDFYKSVETVQLLYKLLNKHNIKLKNVMLAAVGVYYKLISQSVEDKIVLDAVCLLCEQQRFIPSYSSNNLVNEITKISYEWLTLEKERLFKNFSETTSFTEELLMSSVKIFDADLLEKYLQRIECQISDKIILGCKDVKKISIMITHNKKLRSTLFVTKR